MFLKKSKNIRAAQALISSIDTNIINAAIKKAMLSVGIITDTGQQHAMFHMIQLVDDLNEKIKKAQALIT